MTFHAEPMPMSIAVNPATATTSNAADHPQRSDTRPSTTPTKLAPRYPAPSMIPAAVDAARFPPASSASAPAMSE